MRGDELAHAAQLLAPLALDGSRRAAGAGLADVVLGDASLRPGAGDRPEVDAELGRHAPHERRGANAVAGRRAERPAAELRPR